MPDIVNAVCATAANTGVELVLVDEIHNLNLITRAGAEGSDQLKYFAERLPATFVYAGIDVEAEGLFAGVRALHRTDRVRPRFGHRGVLRRGGRMAIRRL